MDVHDAIKYLERRCDGAEIFHEKSEIFYIVAEKNRIRKYVNKNVEGYGIRVLKDKRLGFISTNVLNRNILDDSLKIARNSERVEFFNFPYKSHYKKVITYDPRFDYMNFDILENFMHEALDVAKNFPNVNISYAKIYASRKFIRIVNTNGIYLERKSSYIYIYIDTVYNNSTGFSIKESKFLDIDFSKLSYEACELALKSSNPKILEKKDIGIIFKPIALSELLDEVLLPSFNAENVQRGRSKLKNYLNKKFFDEKLSIYENPYIDYGINSSGFDDEGVPTSSKYLVENGIVRGFLYNNYTAKKEGKESTGNGFRSSYVSPPNIYPTNIILEHKDRGIEYTNSLTVYGLMGIHTSNPITGDFCVEIRNAFYNGIPIKRLLIYGNVFEIFKRIESIGKVYEQHGSYVLPEIKIPPGVISIT